MKLRIVSLFAVVALAVSIGAAAAACGSDDKGGGGGELTLDEYFQELANLDEEKDDALSRLDEKIEAAQTEEEALDAIKEQFSGGVDATKQFVDGLADLNPPAEASDAHGNAVETGREALTALEEVADNIVGAETMADLEAAISDESEKAFDDFDKTCEDLQIIADDNGVETDLDCD